MSKQTNAKKQEHPFLSAFLFTENGKPKSSLIIYSFCLSFVFLAVYFLVIWNAIDILSHPLDRLFSPVLNNLIVSVVSGCVAAGICCIPHFLFRDKRLVFAAHIFLVLYLIAAAVSLSIMQGSLDILLLLGWMAAIPILIGFLLSFFLFKKDYHPDPEASAEPEWKKYVNRR